MKLPSSSAASLLLYLTCLSTKATRGLALTRQERDQALSTRKNAPKPRIRGRALKRGGDGPKSESKQHHEEDQQQETPQETNRVYVRYNSEAGHMHALTRAKEIIQDKDDDDVIILSCEDDCLARFQGDSSIIEADYDYQVAAFGNVDGPARTLEELIPWGLAAIQADTMEVGDDDILICIVDTGIAIGHPDFNSDFISGTDTDKGKGEVWKWNDDRSKLRPSAEIWNRLWSSL
jgi:subtilisin family serine protease